MLEGLSGGLIVAVVNFLMVFLILGGLAGTLVALRKVVQFLEKPTQEMKSESTVITPEPEPLSQENQIKTHIAVIIAAIQEFTGLSPGSFRIDKIEPIEKALIAPQLHIAAIAAALHEFTSMPQGAFRIVGIKPIETANAWKMAGRFELMGLDID